MEPRGVEPLTQASMELFLPVMIVALALYGISIALPS